MNADLDIYLVGGAVRDRLIAEQNESEGVLAADRDWVVVGATAKRLLDLGFLPVGKDFPVFLHPQSKEEYALARTERKQGSGHQGFAVDANPNVTLEEDLSRRDLTINAIAEAPDGRLIDPFNGQSDIAAKRLRHVSRAFTEDPLRVFRVARFAAQLPGFDVDPDTQALLLEMCDNAELTTLSPERVWQEFLKALAGAQPERFFEVLSKCRGLVDWLPECESMALQSLSEKPAEPLARFALLPLTQEALTALAARLRAPKIYAQTVADRFAWLSFISQWPSVDPRLLMKMLVQLNATHNLGRLTQLIALVDAPEHAERLEHELLPLVEALRAIKLTAAEVSGLKGSALGKALNERRQRFLAENLARY